MENTKQRETELLEMLANATATYYSCFGHGKAYRNDLTRKSLARELKELGAEIPSDDELLKIGIFNGKGSV